MTHVAGAGTGQPTFPFKDGLWSGDFALDPISKKRAECWAQTTYDDGTALTLAKQNGGTWVLRVSNPSWRLPAPHRYAMEALVDFYPKLQLAAEAKSETVLEIADIAGISLLGLIENGHTIDLTSDGFNAKYSLEGSAKIIDRLRNCSTE
jgi:hypothetical protein